MNGSFIASHLASNLPETSKEECKLYVVQQEPATSVSIGKLLKILSDNSIAVDPAEYVL